MTRRGWIADIVGGAAVCVLAIAALNAPVVRAAPAVESTFRVLTIAAAATGAVAALLAWVIARLTAIVADGYGRRGRPRMRLGLGLWVLAVGQLYRVAAGPSTPSSDLVFAALLPVGLVIVLVALVQLTQLALRSVETAQWRQQEELAAAEVHRERVQEAAAERDHELRNGLAGLAGITHLLSELEHHERLKHAVLAELGRLHAILDGDRLAVGPRIDYAVEPVIAGLAALRTSDLVTVDVTPGLQASGDPAVLAQIVTNLLVNCDRHAPGAPVTVTARPGGRFVTIEVRDQGPGLPSQGASTAAGPGSGLGLPISRRLAASQGGQLMLRTVADPSGCAATLRLTTPPPDAQEAPVTDSNLPSALYRT